MGQTSSGIEDKAYHTYGEVAPTYRPGWADNTAPRRCACISARITGSDQTHINVGKIIHDTIVTTEQEASHVAERRHRISFDLETRSQRTGTDNLRAPFTVLDPQRPGMSSRLQPRASTTCALRCS